MSNLFKVNVNNTLQFEITDEDLLHLDIFQISNLNYHILQENKSYLASIIDSNFYAKSYSIKINNNIYNISIQNDLDLLIERMGFSSKPAEQLQLIKAPMPGLILEINVIIGQKVKENDNLLILEAMKMENIISAPRSGTIKSIFISKGDAIIKNQLLIEFE